MRLAVLLISYIVISQCRAEKIPGCEEFDNAGVLTFGPLPSDLEYSEVNFKPLPKYYGSPLPKYPLQGLLDRYLIQYAVYYDEWGASIPYITMFFKDNDVFRVVDYVKVNAFTWHDFEKAIVDADYQPNSDLTIRIKFMKWNCDCVMRVYDLKATDIPATATTVPCSTEKVMNNPYRLSKVETHLSTPSMIFLLDENTKYSRCDPRTTVGVHREFGPLHPHVTNPTYFDPVTSSDVTSKKLTDDLLKYKVDFVEYREQSCVGNGDYSYVTLSFDTSGLNIFQPNTGPEYKVIDYLRVDKSNWKDIQDTILEATSSASSDWKLRVKYLTEDCRCVMRVYDLRQEDIPGTAETRACNGRRLKSYPHKLQGTMHQLPMPTPQPGPSSPVKYPGCDPKNNVGVLNDFGRLPLDLTLGDNYRPNIYSNIANTQFRLEGPLKNFQVEYKEFEDRYPVGTGKYAYLVLKYNDGAQNLLLDYIRVNPYKWEDIENAIVDMDVLADGKIRLQFLLSDCSCVTREYNTKIAEFDFRGKTVPCPSSLSPLPASKTTRLTKRKF